MARWTVKVFAPTWMHKEDREFITNNRHEAVMTAEAWKMKYRGAVKIIDNTTGKINPFF